jgi:hypothetical protein
MAQSPTENLRHCGTERSRGGGFCCSAFRSPCDEAIGPDQEAPVIIEPPNACPIAEYVVVFLTERNPEA